MKHTWVRLLCSIMATAVIAPLVSHAQEPEAPIVYVVATPVTNAAAEHYAYVLWQSSDPAWMLDRSFAVYRKSGAPAAPGNYERVGIAALQQHPHGVEYLLNQSVHLGQDLEALESDIDSLFSGFELSGDLTLPEKVLAIVLGSLDDPEDFTTLRFLGHRHPAIALVIGAGHIAPITGAGMTTFEVREWDTVTGIAGGVLGRVSVEAGAPVPLPAPTNLSEIVDADATGHLAVQLFWEPTDELLRLGLLQYGFNVWRVTEPVAISNNWDVTPPTAAELLQEAESDPIAVKRRNGSPILLDGDESPSDPLFTDDNGGLLEGGSPFESGERYYFFVTARDILGRDGILSEGLLVEICDRRPPPPPQGTHVTRVHGFTNGVPIDALRVDWRQNAETGEVQSAAYYVHRWNAWSNLIVDSGCDTNSRISGPIAHLPGVATNSYLDTSLTTNDVGVTYFYGVVAVDDGNCGTNCSGRGATDRGNLQDRGGPGLSTNVDTLIECSVPTARVSFVATKDRPVGEDDVVMVCNRVDIDPRIDWVEFSLAGDLHLNTNALSSAQYFGRRFFADGAPALSVSMLYTNTPSSLTCYMRVGTTYGCISEYAFTNALAPETNEQLTVTFAAEIITKNIPSDECPCDPAPPDDGLIAIPPKIFIVFPQDAHEWEIHCRTGDGPLTLHKKGLGDPGMQTSIVLDAVQPLYCEEICCFVKFLDEHGNDSPMQPLGCEPGGRQALPTPVLAPIEPLGTATNPMMRISWFCSPYGIERFQVVLGIADTNPPTSISDELSDNIAFLHFLDVPRDPADHIGTNDNDGAGSRRTVRIGRYETGRVGRNFGEPESPDFFVDVEIDPDQNALYYVRIDAFGACGEPTVSDIMALQWTLPTSHIVDVPWPARARPWVVGGFDDRIYARFLETTNFNLPFELDCVGVRIGHMYAFSLPATVGDPYRVSGTNDPSDLVFRDINGRSLLPFALYRYQVTNDAFETVSGDVVQVSPLMQRIAHQFELPFNRTMIRDPFIHVLPPETGKADPLGRSDIYMTDTQPVLKSATYRYLVVLFDLWGEISRVIPVSPVTIPDS